MVKKKTAITAAAVSGGLLLAIKLFGGKDEKNLSLGSSSEGDIEGGKDDLGIGAGQALLIQDSQDFGRGSFEESFLEGESRQAPFEGDEPLIIDETQLTEDEVPFSDGLSLTDTLRDVAVFITAEELAKRGFKKVKNKLKPKVDDIDARNKKVSETEFSTRKESIELDAKTNIKDADVKLSSEIEAPKTTIETDKPSFTKTKAGKITKIGVVGEGVLQTFTLGARIRERIDADEFDNTGLAVAAGFVDAGTDLTGSLLGLVYKPKGTEFTESRSKNTGFFATFRDVGDSLQEHGLGTTAANIIGLNDISIAIRGKPLVGNDDEEVLVPGPQTNLPIIQSSLGVNNLLSATRSPEQQLFTPVPISQQVSVRNAATQDLSTHSFKDLSTRQFRTEVRATATKDLDKEDKSVAFSRRQKLASSRRVSGSSLSASERSRAGTSSGKFNKIIRKSGKVEFKRKRFA